MQLFKLIGGALTLLLLWGCASPAPGSPEANAQAAAKMEQMKAEAQEKISKNTPEWYDRPPQSEFAIYGVGTGLQDTMGLAERAAVLAARQNLAEQIEVKLQSSADNFIDGETYSALGVGEMISTVARSVAQNDLFGSRKIDGEHFSVNGKIQYFAILEVPVGNANRALVERLRRDQRISQNEKRKEMLDRMEEQLEKTNP